MIATKLKPGSVSGFWLATAVTAALTTAGPVLAQEGGTQGNIEEIIVTETGTSVRGAPPVGQNLISVGELAIEESGAVSVQQILNDVPQITGFGNAAQGAYGSADGSGTFAPTIHSLGASASNSTLVLVNGHRIPLSGTRHTLADPSIIPPAALRRVDILPDGASAVYGSDAVAGVLNFVTKKGVEDTEVSAQVGFGDGYDTQNVNFVTGSAWDGGSVTLAYAYSHRSKLASKDRPKITSDLRDRGGRNFSSFNCGPATVITGGVRYAAPYGATDSFTDAYCNTDAYTSLIGDEKRNSVFLSYQKEFSDNLLLDMEVVYSDRKNLDDISAGTLSTTATNANPYFVAPAGTGVTSETINWDANQMLGAAKGIGTQQVFYAAPKLEYDFGNSWLGSLSAMVGRDSATEIDQDELCSFCASDLLNDTDPATALDVWSSSPSVSPSQLLYLQDSMDEQRAVQSISDVVLKFDGEIFDLPGGPAKLAVGANSIRYNLNQVRRRPSVSGPASSNTQVIDTDIDRDVTAFFGEIYLPITERFDVNLAVRADDYSDFGSTTNPRFAAQYQLTDSLKIRATYAESFVAPALTSRGEEPTGQTTESGWGVAGTQRSFIPNDFSDDSTAAYIAWAQANFPASCTADGCYINDGQIRGAQVTGGNYGLNAATGETWSIGIDLINPDWASGLRLSVTYYDKLLEQMVTAPRLDVITVVPGLNNRLILMPTQAELDAWTFGLQQNSVLPTMPGLPAGVPAPFVWSFQQVNAFNIDSAGFDVSLDYSWDTDVGDFIAAFSFNKKTRFDQQAGTGGIWQDFLNGDLNTTFSSLEFLSTASLTWNRDNLSAKLSWKYTNAYDVRNDPLQSKVDAYNLFNLYVSYDLDNWDAQVYLQGSNILDEDPPFFNTNGGYNSSESSPIGRVMTLGLRKTF